MTTERKVYTEEFKRAAVRLAKERGNIAQTARDLGLSDNTLQGWKQQLEKTPDNPFLGNGNPRDAEFAQLQRENARLLFSRRVVGWAMGQTLERTLVLAALDMAGKGRQPAAGLLCHRDRGSQYASSAYQDALKKAGATCSMSRKGNGWDNAPTESFFATLKRELVYRTRFACTEEARSAIFRWIEVWYNRKRRHSTLGYLSPEAFERHYQQQQEQQQQRPVAA